MPDFVRRIPSGDNRERLVLAREEERRVATPAQPFEVDETPLPLKPAVAFPNLKWTGWSAESEDGKGYSKGHTTH